ncbi:hypothetical protein GGI03_002935 [Coemansia sp. RSA 2337]|nr:hypothetical protein GGI03_002935 [Coemansia sp. RSA 2337]
MPDYIVQFIIENEFILEKEVSVDKVNIDDLRKMLTNGLEGVGKSFANEFMYRWGWRGARPVAVAGRNGRVFPVGEKARDAADAIHELID